MTNDELIRLENAKTQYILRQREEWDRLNYEHDQSKERERAFRSEMLRTDPDSPRMQELVAAIKSEVQTRVVIQDAAQLLANRFHSERN